jgi:hypothetical protein
MAVNDTRSMNAELAEGRTDGSVAKVVRDRGGEVDSATRRARQSLHADRGWGHISEDPPTYWTGEEGIPR